MRVAGRLGIGGLMVAVCLAVTAPAANALAVSVKALADPQTTYTVSGTAVTIQSTDVGLLRFVRGTEVDVDCISQRETTYWDADSRWGSRASAMTVRFKRAVTDVGRCSAVEVGRTRLSREFLGQTIEFSAAAFTARWRRLLASTVAPGLTTAQSQLSLDWAAIEVGIPNRFKAADGVPFALPPAVDVVASINRLPRNHGPHLRYARTLAGVTQLGVTYVIARASGRTRMELAVLGYDGRLYVARAQVGTRRSYHFGPA